MIDLEPADLVVGTREAYRDAPNSGSRRADGVATEPLKIQCLGNVLAPTSWCSERVPDRIADVRGRAARLGAVQRA